MFSKLGFLCQQISWVLQVQDRLFGVVVNTNSHSRGPRFDFRLCCTKFSESIGSRMGSTQPRDVIGWLLDMMSIAKSVTEAKIKADGLRHA